MPRNQGWKKKEKKNNGEKKSPSTVPGNCAGQGIKNRGRFAKEEGLGHCETSFRASGNIRVEEEGPRGNPEGRGGAKGRPHRRVFQQQGSRGESGPCAKR